MDKIVLTESGRWYKYVGDSTHDVPETGQDVSVGATIGRPKKQNQPKPSNQKGEEGHEHN